MKNKKEKEYGVYIRYRVRAKTVGDALDKLERLVNDPHYDELIDVLVVT